ncbi:hypothetical protein [Flocculibacter collagenilyticus]|uniref:hypothetical protein n=1 Tax=Flocculibacter collagenilyticus TaxID=2744479 RepID=UPI0018F6E77A|nr:hypothetical protein [Flocculibacter collagenilyticus]
MALTPAQKQKRYRDKQKGAGKKEIRAYLSPDAITCYEDVRELSGWDDSTLVSNAIRLMYAAKACGQVQLLNNWLTEHKK